MEIKYPVMTIEKSKLQEYAVKVDGGLSQPSEGVQHYMLHTETRKRLHLYNVF